MLPVLKELKDSWKMSKLDPLIGSATLVTKTSPFDIVLFVAMVPLHPTM